jgi:hypothetical protein
VGNEDRTVSQKMQVSFEGSASIFFGDINLIFKKKQTQNKEQKNSNDCKPKNVRDFFLQKKLLLE